MSETCTRTVEYMTSYADVPRNGRRKTKWNLMAYIVGDQSLSGSMISQLKELTDAGFQKDTTVLAFFDPNSNGKNARIFDVNGQRKRERREKEESETIIGDGRDPFVRDIAEDYQVPALPQLPAAIALRYFLEYARCYYPAENYMLFLVGHGVIVGNDTFLPDPDDNSSITLSDLGWILKDFSNKVRQDKDELQLVGFHSCSMSSVELAHELSGVARYMMGTQGSALPGSWPYRQLLKKIFGVIEDSKKNDASAVLKEMLRSLQALTHFNSEDFWLAGYSADLAICSLKPNRINKLKLRLRDLSRALKQGLQDPATVDCIQLAHLKSQSYWGEAYSDLYDFCHCLQEQCKRNTECHFEIRNACQDVKNALSDDEEDRLIIYSDYYGPAYQHSHGLSIFFPWRSPDAKVQEIYANYSFTTDYEEDSWWSFLEQYFVATRREPRLKHGRPIQPEAAIRVRKYLFTTNAVRSLSSTEILSLSQMAPPEKVLVTVDPQGKVLGVEPPGKVLGVEPPGKVLGVEPPGKVLGVEPPGKVLGVEPPGKVLGPPDKVLGFFGFSVIKNFYAVDGVFVTSRPQGFRDRKDPHSQNGKQ
ncbi:MAG TPA: clostripain-related cysteine peptidase [Pyrinomonadaceae bacterium]|nr:clostripain-related cysteine peptidase [Pyrinomonadaceae bacterium]